MSNSKLLNSKDPDLKSYGPELESIDDLLPAVDTTFRYPFTIKEEGVLTGLEFIMMNYRKDRTVTYRVRFADL